MVKHALSKSLHSRLLQKAKADKIANAENAYHSELKKSPSRRRGLRKIATEYSISHTTLAGRVHGKLSTLEFNAVKQKLTVSEEHILCELMALSADRSLPFTHAGIKQCANKLLEARLEPDYKPVSDSWLRRFLDRHRKQIRTYWSKPLDTQRAQSLNPSAVKHWFDLLQHEVIEKGILPENIYGMDESGFPPANQGVVRVIGRAGNKIQHKQGGASRENVTALVTICADGTALSPTIVFKGERIMSRWTQDNPAHASFASSQNGWTDREIALDWLQKVFEPLTREKAAGRIRVLILDGHSSHYSLAFLDYAVQHNIVVLGYPPHCTHALQGLDVVCFAKMKKTWNEAIDEYEDRTGLHVGKDTFAGVFGRAYLKAFDPETIASAFRVTGVHPFDRSVISAQQTKPSESTSTQISTTFPLPQPSPVRRIMAVFHHHQPTSFELDPDTHLPAPTTPSTPSYTPVQQQSRSPTSTVTTSKPSEIQKGGDEMPDVTGELVAAEQEVNVAKDDIQPITCQNGRTSEKRAYTTALDQTIDPALYTPSKRARILTGSLAMSNSASFLVSRAKLHSGQTIPEPTIETAPSLPEPDWSLLDSQKHIDFPAHMTYNQLKERADELTVNLALAHRHVAVLRSINEAANAQLVFQNLYTAKLKSALGEKEKKKKKDATVIFADGMGRVLTEPEVREYLAEQARRKAQEESEKEQRQQEAKTRRTEKEQLEAGWDLIKRKHDMAVSVYAEECVKWRAEGRKKKDYTPKPKRPKKPETLQDLERALLEVGGQADGRDKGTSDDATHQHEICHAVTGVRRSANL